MSFESTILKFMKLAIRNNSIRNDCKSSMSSFVNSQSFGTALNFSTKLNIMREIYSYLHTRQKWHVIQSITNIEVYYPHRNHFQYKDSKDLLNTIPKAFQSPLLY